MCVCVCVSVSIGYTLFCLEPTKYMLVNDQVLCCQMQNHFEETICSLKWCNKSKAIQTLVLCLLTDRFVNEQKRHLYTAVLLHTDPWQVKNVF